MTNTRCPKKTPLSEVFSFSLRSVFLGHPVFDLANKCFYQLIKIINFVNVEKMKKNIASFSDDTDNWQIFSQ